MPYLGSATLWDVQDLVRARPAVPARGRAILEAIQETVPAGETPAEPDSPDSLLRRGCYVDGIVHIGAQLADALVCIHAQGICHRDLKPSNVLMSPDDRPMLLNLNLSFDEHPPHN